MIFPKRVLIEGLKSLPGTFSSSSMLQTSPEKFYSNKNCSRCGTIKIVIYKKGINYWGIFGLIQFKQLSIRSEITKSAIDKS